MQAILLGAGYGTRLYPLTKDRPKTLLPIAGKPMVEWILARLAAVPGLDGVALVTNDRFAGHHARWLAQASQPLKVTLVNDGTKSDADKLGAVGDIRLARDRLRLDDDLLVVAGDNLFELDVAAFAAFFRERQAPVIALKNMKGSSLISRYSVVTLDASSRVTAFEEKPARPKTHLIAICLYLFPKASLGLLDAYFAQGGNPDAPGYYIQWLCRQTAAYGWVFDAPWFDIGDIDSYNEANARYGGAQAGR
jgi:glucose-1-phosphate thymidylyltransferase